MLILKLRVAVIAGLMLWSTPGVGSASSVIAEGDVSVTISDGAGGMHVVHGEFTTNASIAAVWSTLTDYSGMPSFVPSVKESRLMPGPVVVQTMSGNVGPFHKSIFVDLAIAEFPMKRIDFRDFGERSFSRYVGSWRIHDDGDRTTVFYDLEVKPRFFAPGFLTNSAFRRSLTMLLFEVRSEAQRRARAPAMP